VRWSQFGLSQPNLARVGVGLGLEGAIKGEGWCVCVCVSVSVYVCGCACVWEGVCEVLGSVRKGW
jgi:hypothetical protein